MSPKTWNRVLSTRLWLKWKTYRHCNFIPNKCENNVNTINFKTEKVCCQNFIGFSLIFKTSIKFSLFFKLLSPQNSKTAVDYSLFSFFKFSFPVNIILTLYCSKSGKVKMSMSSISMVSPGSVENLKLQFVVKVLSAVKF